MSNQTQPIWNVTQELNVSGRINQNGSASKSSNDQTGDYTLLPTDSFVRFTDTSAARTATLPDATAVPSQTFEIKDAGGQAGTFNISWATVSSQTIDGSAPGAAVTANYGSAKVRSNGTNYESTL